MLCFHHLSFSFITENEDTIKNGFNIIKEKYNKFDALINCAGVPGIEKVNEITYSCLENVMKINSIAPMFLTSRVNGFNKRK